MTRAMLRALATLIGLTLTHAATAGEFAATVPLFDGGASTYYVSGEIDGYGGTEFLVDTGSAYMTINERTLDVLKGQGKAEYVKRLSAVLADGSRTTVPVYRISGLSVGDNCHLRNVEAAVFRGSTRHILGLSALKKAGTFQLSFAPPRLSLSSCASGAIAASR